MAANVNNKRFVNFVELAMEYLESSSDGDDSDEEIELLIASGERVEIPKITNYIENVVANLEDTQFKSHFRVLRRTCYALIEQFAHSKFYPAERKGGSILISAEKHILSFLWSVFLMNKFAGNKCIRDISDRFNMSLSTFHSVEMRVISFFIDILPKIINFPRTDAEKESTAAEFAKISGFPNILGSVDGSYIEIRTPSHKLKSTYTNRHDIPCVTLQGICNAKKKFIDVFTGPPGKIHDSRIFKLSFISSEIATLTNNGHYHLIGDSAYPIREWLLTPFKDYGNVTEQQKNYNKKLSRARVKIENSFGLLKGRFRQLQRLHFHKVLKSSQFILACCVLHNICIEFNDNCEEIAIEDNNATNIDNVVDRESELKRLGELKTAVCLSNNK